MGTSCDGCGRAVSIAGGSTNLWHFSDDSTSAFTLELEDGPAYLLCGPCLDALPEEPTQESVESLEWVDDETSRRDD